MKFRSIFLFLLIANFHGALAETNSEVLEKVWSVGQTQACSGPMRARFSESALQSLKSQIKDEGDRDGLAEILNPFLFSLGYSHTQFFTNKMESYYLFRAYNAKVNASAPPAPLLVNPGIQVGSDEHGFFVREALDGLPARNAGLVKGDRILLVDGEPFSGFFGFQAKEKATVRVLHRGHLKDVSLALPALDWAQAFEDATLASIQILHYKTRSIGYVHLWSGVHPDSASALWTAVRRFQAAHVNGVILDLRGGYGGAFWDHLDPFFADRKDYFVMTAFNGDDVISILKPDPAVNRGAYLGPMAVLIDEGSRSGKEAMAYQFKKSKRAILVGNTTAGYFSGGGMFLMEQPVDYMLYLCVMRDSTLDGVRIEGVGVSPNISIPYFESADLQDSQLKAAMKALIH